MPKLSVGDTVYVASSLLNPPPQQAFEFAMASGRVVACKNQNKKGGNQVEIEYNSVAGPKTSPPISVSKVHKHLGILVVRIGDFKTESLLLDPLAKSIRDFCRLLIDQVQLLEVRSLEELKDWCGHNGNIRLYSHVILVGHGSKANIEFASGHRAKTSSTAKPIPKTASEIGKALHISKSVKKVVVSLACETGHSAFAKDFSKSTSCLFFIGPETAGSGAIGSLLCQHFLVMNIVNGETPGVAFKHARDNVNHSPTYALWQRGSKKA